MINSTKIKYKQTGYFCLSDYVQNRILISQISVRSTVVTRHGKTDQIAPRNINLKQLNDKIYRVELQAQHISCITIFYSKNEVYRISHHGIGKTENKANLCGDTFLFICPGIQ